MGNDGFGAIPRNPVNLERSAWVSAGLELLLPGRGANSASQGAWVFGHVADKLAQAGVSPAFGQPQEVIQQVTDWWAQDRKDSAIKAHHIAASFAPRIAAELLRRGCPLEAMLLTTVHQTLSQFAARFYPGQTLGWVAGCCYNGNSVPQVHAIIHPETTEGELLRLSRNKAGEIGEDRFEYLCGEFNKRARQLYVGLTTKDREPSAESKLAASQMMVMAYHAENVANPDKEEDRSAALSLLHKWAGSREYAEVLEESVRSAEALLYVTGHANVDSEGIRANWDHVRSILEDACQAHLQTAGAALKTVAGSRKSPSSYRPVTSPHAAPGVPLEGDYYGLAGQPTGKRIGTLEGALLARRRESDRQRVRFAEAIKSYRDSVQKIQTVLDQTHLRAANGALRIATMAHIALRTIPAHHEVGISPGKPTPRAVLSLSKTEAYAESRMASITVIEADAHQPEDRSKKPTLLASKHTPKFREFSFGNSLVDEL